MEMDNDFKEGWPTKFEAQRMQNEENENGCRIISYKATGNNMKFNAWEGW